MGLWDTFFGRKKAGEAGQPTAISTKNTPPLRPIGHDDGRCPSCSIALTKLPRQKRACEHCGQMIYPRKRPLDGKVVLFREDELEQLEEQRAIAYGTYDFYVEDRRVREAMRAELTRKFGGAPSESDVSWAIFNADLVKHASAGHWGLYRNTKLAMAQQLTEEKKLTAALETWMEVAYLDMNGASNIGTFDLEFAQLLPHTTGQIEDCIRELGISKDAVKAHFAAACRRAPSGSRLTVSVERAWGKLQSALAE